MAITVYKQKTINKKLQEKNPKKFSEKIKSDFFMDFFLQNHEKQNHIIAGITNFEIKKCGDPVYMIKM